MEPASAVAAKRRVLIDALMMCLCRSRVVQVVDAGAVRGVLDSAAGEPGKPTPSAGKPGARQTGLAIALSLVAVAGGSLTATITDPKWDTLSSEKRKVVASQLLDAEAPKGIKALILLDPGGGTRAIVTETPGGRTVVLP